MLITNAKIMTMDNDVFYDDGYIAVKDGKILSVGEMKNAPIDEDITDVEGAYVVPGFIDAHCHLGVFGDSIGFEGSDGNESTDPLTPQLRAIDAINPLDRCFEDARNSGVTTVVTGPGSANVIGGQTAAVKTYGRRIDDMIVKAPCSLKCAFGENPKKVYNDKNKSPVTRMATAAMLREALCGAVSYGEKLSAGCEGLGRDLKNEALLAVLNKQIPLHAHAHRADDIFTAIRIAKEFAIDVKIVHGTEGHLIADELAKEQIDVMVGPSLSDRSKPELRNLTFETAAILQNAGVRVAIVTDHPEIPVNYLLLCAQLAVKNGMNALGALKSITSDAAAIAGIDDKLGKLTKGYDADFVIFDKNPLCFDTKILFTIINGEKIYK